LFVTSIATRGRDADDESSLDTVLAGGAGISDDRELCSASRKYMDRRLEAIASDYFFIFLSGEK
jgi:hypothetical protein